MSNLYDHAKFELEYCGFLDEDKDFYGGETGKAVLELVEVFSKQGHSGMSAGIVSDIFNKVSRYEPISPLTGKDDEWNECRDGVFQNKRCSHVFKQKDRFDGQAYDIDGRIFRMPDGACFTSRGSHVPIEFPYVPKREYVDISCENCKRDILLAHKAGFDYCPDCVDGEGWEYGNG